MISLYYTNIEYYYVCNIYQNRLLQTFVCDLNLTQWCMVKKTWEKNSYFLRGFRGRGSRGWEFGMRVARGEKYACNQTQPDISQLTRVSLVFINFSFALFVNLTVTFKLRYDGITKWMIYWLTYIIFNLLSNALNWHYIQRKYNFSWYSPLNS